MRSQYEANGNVTASLRLGLSLYQQSPGNMMVSQHQAAPPMMTREVSLPRRERNLDCGV
jgi:hypothetical protein